MAPSNSSPSGHGQEHHISEPMILTKTGPIPAITANPTKRSFGMLEAHRFDGKGPQSFQAMIKAMSRDDVPTQRRATFAHFGLIVGDTTKWHCVWVRHNTESQRRDLEGYCAIEEGNSGIGE